jgi:hypothetical protein
LVEKKQFGRFAFLTQAVGALFFAVFLASYALALPSNQVLHGEPIFRSSLSIFGGLFLTLVVIAIMLSFIIKPED